MFPFSINLGFLHPFYNNPPQGLRVPPGKCVRVRHGGFKMTFQALISPQIFRTFILLLFFSFFHDFPDFIVFYGAICGAKTQFFTVLYDVRRGRQVALWVAETSRILNFELFFWLTGNVWKIDQKSFRKRNLKLQRAFLGIHS